MKKQDYQQPTMKVVKIQNKRLLSGSLRGVSGNAGLNYSGAGGDHEARSRGGSSWDDEDW